MYILQTKIEVFNSYSRIVYKYMYSMTVMHVNRTQVTDTHTELLIHSLGPFYKCYNL